MKKRTKTAFIVLLLIVSLTCITQESQANEVVLEYDGFGHLIPNNETYLMMPQAEVLFEIVNVSEVTDYNIKFNANYTIFNPNETINVLIGAPFSDIKESAYADVFITANGSVVDAELIHVEGHEQDPWHEYVGLDIYRDILVTNYTFITQTSTIIHYSFEYTVSQDDNSYKPEGVFISYIVGTARAWDGNITETVEFIVHDQQPTNYWCFCDWDNNDPSVHQIEDGYSYIWSWDEEQIQEDAIEVYFPYYNVNPSFYKTPIITMSFVVLFITIYRRRKKRTI